MKNETWIAGALVVLCGVAALGAWFTKQPAPDAERAGLDRGMFSGNPGIAQLDIVGMIVDTGTQGGFGGGGTVSSQLVMQAIEKIREDNVPVVLLNINSPGGTASASDAIYQELVKLKKDKGTKIVASFGDMAASGGYYIACAADRIVSNPASLTGSIGVIVQAQNIEGLFDKIGVSSQVINSGPHKDIMSPYRPLEPKERQILQSIVDDSYDQFLAAVSAGRNMPMAQLKPLADGRIYTGRQAHKVKLVDQLGTFLDAKATARELGGLGPRAEIKNYSEEDWRDLFNSLFVTTGAAANPVGAMVSAKHRLLASGALHKVPLALYE